MCINYICICFFGALRKLSSQTIISERDTHSLGVLNANLRYMCIYGYVEVCMSSLLVARAPCDVKGRS